MKKIANRLSQMANVMEKIITEVEQEKREQSSCLNIIEEQLANLKGWIELLKKEAEQELKDVYRYEGPYGILEIDIKRRKVVRDELKRQEIWNDAKDSYLKQHNLYASIMEELFGEDIAKIFPAIYKNEKWHGKPAERGFKASNDEIELLINEEGTFIKDKEEWILSYGPQY